MGIYMLLRSISITGCNPRRTADHRRRLAASCLLLLSVVLLTACARQQKEEVSWPDRSDSFAKRVLQINNAHSQTTGSEWSAFVDAVVSEYRAQFDRVQPGAVAEISDAELEARFLATLETAFYAVNSRPVDHDWLLHELLDLLEAMAARGLATTTHYRRTHQVAIRARRFDFAARLSDAHPEAGLEPLPSIHAEDAPKEGLRVWRYRAQSQQLVLEEVALARGPALLVVMIPRCGPARRAAAHIADDPELAPLLARHGRWLVMPSMGLDLPAQEQWEAQFPQFPLANIHRAEDWPFLDDLGRSPVFYVVNGERELVAKLVGWPHEGRGKELLALLRSAGIEPGNAAD